LLALSQGSLSLQLPVAVILLERFVTDRSNMGSLVAGCGLVVFVWCVSAIIVALRGVVARRLSLRLKLFLSETPIKLVRSFRTIIFFP
jgi:Mn2+/Fe2+ NRAMP family transporter